MPHAPRSMDLPPSDPAISQPVPGEPEWRRWLSGSSPRDVLAKLVEGDPLRLHERCEERLRAQALLIDEHRLRTRVAAYVARHANSYAGAPSLDVWIASHVRQAVRDLTQEMTELTGAGLPLPVLRSEMLLTLASSLGIDPEQIGTAFTRFNRERYEVRAAFVGLVLCGEDPVEWNRANASTPERTRASLRRALWALGVSDDLDPDDLLQRGDDDE